MRLAACCVAETFSMLTLVIQCCSIVCYHTACRTLELTLKTPLSLHCSTVKQIALLVL